MKKLRTILLATDFGKSSDNLLRYAMGLAKIFQSRIIPVYVLPDDIKKETVTLLLRETAIKRLDILQDKMKAGGLETMEYVLESGNPRDKIIEVAQKVNADLILMGSGEKVKGIFLHLSDLTTKVIRRSPKPVWVVKQEDELDIRRIICAVSFSAQSKRALKNTITLARKFKAGLIIFSVSEIYHQGTLRRTAYWDKVNEKERLVHVSKLNSFLSDLDLSGIDCKTEVVSGRPSKAILNAISRQKSDLLIMGTTEKSFLDRLMMGSVTERVVEKVPCSFVTLKNEDIIDIPRKIRIRKKKR
ncbi:MAG: universal stress protein [Draconibacterium sp.]